MRISHPLHFLLFTMLITLTVQPSAGQKPGRAERIAVSRMEKWISPVPAGLLPETFRIDSLKTDEQKKEVIVYFPVTASYNPIREDIYASLVGSVKASLGKRFSGYTVVLFSNGFSLRSLVPNYFRSVLSVDSSRIVPFGGVRPRLVSRTDAVTADRGLAGRYIALWHSHGYYFDQPLDRWEWQRAKLFGSVEDLSVMAYVVPYLAPMLENSGATLFLPRERDIQVNEVIVDNDRSTGSSRFELLPPAEVTGSGRGFILKDTLFTGDNPFMAGTSLRIRGGSALFVPDIPERGWYGVTVSYPQIHGYYGKVSIKVTHTGGVSEFTVDQSLGGGTWLWLGSYLFDAGMNAGRGAVTVTGLSGSDVLVDAIRFGGGMGNVARRPADKLLSNQWSLNAGGQQSSSEAAPVTLQHSWKLSGKPRFLEAARYWLQYAGMPDTLVYTPNKGRNDYNDDYMSRAEWVNYLVREPDSTALTGLGIPIDLSFAFHTDAGVTPGDSVIGTLGIYSTITNGGKFPDGTARLASRDLTDIIQTQIVEDVRVLFNPDWTRRAMWDRSYYEARKPDVPAMLLELLSHQNLADQRYGFDPRFRFHVSRAVYKGILRYLADASGSDYTVHPLPVSHFSIEPVEGKKVRLSWRPVADPLESTAMPASYRVFMRKCEDGFNNGTTVTGTSFETELPEYNTVFSFRVTALNAGGESFPSEELAVGISPDAEDMILIVNGFDRISGPVWFDRGGMAGVAWWDDRGVADRYNFISTGDQYDFNRVSPWTDDDNSGWGASYSNDEGRVIPGNTFDFTAVHGRSVLAAGRSFCSVSDEVFTGGDFNLTRWSAVDLLFGEEKTTPATFDPGKRDFSIYTTEFLNALARMKEASIPVFMSGAYVGTDLVMTADTAITGLIRRALHFFPRTGHAVRTGNVAATDIGAPDFTGRLEFNAGKTDEIYAAESPDAIEPADKQSFTALRYTENNTSAAVMHRGDVRSFIMGFPFETIILKAERDALMKQILDFLLK
ncbi:MAG: xanthan lyase [Bacteroidales bacterium]